MPARQKRYDAVFIAFPWVNKLRDPCLKENVAQALLARGHAVDEGGDDRIIGAGDASLAQIEYGRVKGKAAWQQASYALRKYTEAYMRAYRPSRADYMRSTRATRRTRKR